MANPPPYTPLFADAVNIAQAQRDLITPLLAADTPPLTPPPIGPYEAACVDGDLLSRGLQFRSIAGIGSLSHLVTMPLTPAFEDAGFGSVVFTPRITRTYLLETRVSMSVVNLGLVRLRYVVNSTPVSDDEGAFFFNNSNVHARIDFLVPVALTKDVAYTISWEWIGYASQQLYVDTNDVRVFRVWT